MSHDTVIALVLGEDAFAWTAMQRRKHRAEITEQKQVEAAWPEGLADHRSAEAAAHVKTRLPPFKGRLGLAIPANRVLMRIMELPSTDPEELEGMAALQIDKISPFPSDQMALAMEVLEQGEESSRVLIAAVQHDYINRLGEFMIEAGLYPQSVDVDVLGWWQLIRASGRVSEEGQHVLVIHDGDSAQLLVVRGGQPVMIRALDASLDLDDAAFASELADEIEYTLMTLESAWGAAPVDRIALWTRAAAPETLAAAVAEASGLPAETFSLDDLPPLSEGLCRRMAGPGSLDLAPDGWKQTIQSRKYQRRAVAIAAAVFGVWAMLMAGLWFWSSRQKNLLADAQRETVRLQSEVESVRELRSQVESLQQYADRTYSGLECLREIAEILPSDVDITSFTYSKGAQVNLRGEADSDRPINDFIANLEKSALFPSVRTEGISTQQRGGRTRSLFRVTMTLPTIGEEPES